MPVKSVRSLLVPDVPFLSGRSGVVLVVVVMFVVGFVCRFPLSRDGDCNGGAPGQVVVVVVLVDVQWPSPGYGLRLLLLSWQPFVVSYSSLWKMHLQKQWNKHCLLCHRRQHFKGTFKPCGILKDL